MESAGPQTVPAAVLNAVERGAALHTDEHGACTDLGEQLCERISAERATNARRGPLTAKRNVNGRKKT